MFINVVVLKTSLGLETGLKTIFFEGLGLVLDSGFYFKAGHYFFC